MGVEVVKGRVGGVFVCGGPARGVAGGQRETHGRHDGCRDRAIGSNVHPKHISCRSLGKDQEEQWSTKHHGYQILQICCHLHGSFV